MRRTTERPASFVTGRVASGAAALWIVAAVAGSGCTSAGPGAADPPCVVGLTKACSATYDPPVYDTIFAKILRPTCATGGSSCHAAAGHQNGLVLEDADASYALLLGQGGARARVTPGDPSCSLIMKRLTSTDPSYHMPPGTTSLSAGDQCTIVQWISAGAKR